MIDFNEKFCSTLYCSTVRHVHDVNCSQQLRFSLLPLPPPLLLFLFFSQIFNALIGKYSNSFQTSTKSASTYQKIHCQPLKHSPPPPPNNHEIQLHSQNSTLLAPNRPPPPRLPSSNHRSLPKTNNLHPNLDLGPTLRLQIPRGTK